MKTHREADDAIRPLRIVYNERTDDVQDVARLQKPSVPVPKKM